MRPQNRGPAAHTHWTLYFHRLRKTERREICGLRKESLGKTIRAGVEVEL